MTENAADPDPCDLFISYAHADDADGWVAGLVDLIQRAYTRLRNAPLQIFFDREAIRSMQDWEDRILVGLRGAKAMLAVVSPAYLQSEFCRREWEIFRAHEAELPLAAEGIAPVYLVTAPQLDDEAAAKNDPWLADLRRRQYVDLRPFRDAGPGALEGKAARALVKRIADRINLVERCRLSPSTIPPHNPNFVGRTDELRRLHQTLACGRVGAVAGVQGIGGIGKSALAFEYAYRYAAEYPGGRFLVPAAGATDLRIPIIQLAPHCGVTLSEADDRNPDRAFAKVRAALERGPRVLLVVDNVDDPGLVTPEQRARCLPGGDRVHVLITTRLEPRAVRGVECLPLETLPDATAVELLENHRPIDDPAQREAAFAVVRRLGGHAWAVEVVAVYLWQNPEISYSEYLVWLEDEGLGAIEGAGADELVELSRHPQTLLRPLLEPTLETLTPAQSLVLEYAAFLPADRVVLPWLRELAAGEHAELAGSAEPGRPCPWERLLRRLDGLRLLVRGDDARLARVHRLVQDCVRARLADDTASQRHKALVRHARDRADFLDEGGWVGRQNRWEIEPLRDYAELLMEAEDLGGAVLADTVAGRMSDLGRFGECQQLRRRALQIEQKAYEPVHPILGAHCSNLALVERDLGNLAEARGLLRRAVEIWEKVYEPEHPVLAASLCNLAVVEKDLGHLAEARRLLCRAVDIWEKAYEPDHPTLATSYSNLAMVERDLGNLAEARALLHRAVEIKEKAYEPDRPTLATSYSNLAMVEQDLGNLAEARGLLRRAIEIEEKAYEPDHPTLAIRYSNLGAVERDLGNLAEARALLRRAVEIEEKAYEPDHPALAARYSNLATIERDLGNLAEARGLLRRAVEIEEKAYEPDHPKLAIRYSNLAYVEAELGNADDARGLMRRAYRIRRDRLGPEHPDTQSSQRWLAEHDPEFRPDDAP